MLLWFVDGCRFRFFVCCLLLGLCGLLFVVCCWCLKLFVVVRCLSFAVSRVLVCLVCCCLFAC